MEKSLLKYLYPPKETQSAHLGPSTEAAVRLHSLIIPHPPTRKGIFINSTKKNPVCGKHSVPVLTDKPREQGKRRRKFTSFSLFPVWKSFFFLDPGVITWKKEPGDPKVSLGQEEKGPEKLTLHFWGLFPVFHSLFPQSTWGEAVAQLICPTASWHENNLLFPLNFLQKHLRKFSGKICSFPLRNLAVLWVGCENKDEFPFTLRRYILEFLSTFYERILYKLHKQVQKGPIFLYLQWSLF